MTSPQRTLQRLVDCSCDGLLARPILLRREVHACMRCGVVTVADAIWDEPHPHVVEVHGYHVVPLEEELTAWLRQWPRVAGASIVQLEVFLPANARIEDAVMLADMEMKMARVILFTNNLYSLDANRSRGRRRSLGFSLVRDRRRLRR